MRANSTLLPLVDQLQPLADTLQPLVSGVQSLVDALQETVLLPAPALLGNGLMADATLHGASLGGAVAAPTSPRAVLSPPVLVAAGVSGGSEAQQVGQTDRRDTRPGAIGAAFSANAVVGSLPAVSGARALAENAPKVSPQSPQPSPNRPVPPGTVASAGAGSTGGGSLFLGLAALAVLLMWTLPRLCRRLSLPSVAWRPTPFLSLLEQPG